MSPARRAALRGRPPRLRGGRVRRPGASRPPRPASTRATARSPSSSRTGRCSASGRSTTGSRRSASGRCGSSTRRCARRCALGAYQLAYLDRRRRPRGGERVRRARPRGAARARGAVHERGHAAARRQASATCSTALPEGPLKHSYPDWVGEIWRRDWGDEEALALMRAQNEAPETVVRLVRGEVDGEPTDVPGAYRVERVDEQALAEGRIWPQSRGSQLAGLAVGVAGGRARARPLRRAGREGDDARGRGRRGRAPRGPRARAGGERRAGSARRTSASSTPTRSRSRRADRLRPGARRRAVLGARRARGAARPALARAAAAGAPARAPARGRRARAARRRRSSTRSAR